MLFDWTNFHFLFTWTQFFLIIFCIFLGVFSPHDSFCLWNSICVGLRLATCFILISGRPEAAWPSNPSFSFKIRKREWKKKKKKKREGERKVRVIFTWMQPFLGYRWLGEYRFLWQWEDPEVTVGAVPLSSLILSLNETRDRDGTPAIRKLTCSCITPRTFNLFRGLACICQHWCRKRN